jgi:hypothetical protein
MFVLNEIRLLAHYLLIVAIDRKTIFRLFSPQKQLAEHRSHGVFISYAAISCK